MQVNTGKTNPVAVAVIGMPRSGSTIITHFLNAIDGVSMWGEPHRSKMKKPFRTRYGAVDLYADRDRLEQMKAFAVEKNLSAYGFKEVWDPYLPLWPLDVVGMYGNRLDLIILALRDPRRNYSSMLALGHAKKVDPHEFTSMYVALCDYCQKEPRCRPVILDEFRKNQLGSIQRATGWRLAGRAELSKQYTGGGDPHAMKAAAVTPNEYRPPYIGAGLEQAEIAYLQTIRSGFQ